MFMGFGSDGAGTWYIRKKVVDYLPLGMVLAYTERRHGVSIRDHHFTILMDDDHFELDFEILLGKFFVCNCIYKTIKI